MKNIILLGSSGMIGGIILDLCLKREEIASVTVINRKRCNINHPKIKEIIHSNFMNFSTVSDVFKNKDICFYCVGVYTGLVPTEEFNKITID